MLCYDVFHAYGHVFCDQTLHILEIFDLQNYKTTPSGFQSLTSNIDIDETLLHVTFWCSLMEVHLGDSIFQFRKKNIFHTLSVVLSVRHGVNFKQ